LSVRLVYIVNVYKTREAKPHALPVFYSRWSKHLVRKLIIWFGRLDKVECSPI